MKELININMHKYKCENRPLQESQGTDCTVHRIRSFAALTMYTLALRTVTLPPLFPKIGKNICVGRPWL